MLCPVYSNSITQRRLSIIHFQSVVHRPSSEVNSWLAGQEKPFIDMDMSYGWVSVCTSGRHQLFNWFV